MQPPPGGAFIGGRGQVWWGWGGKNDSLREMVR
jgi:hypothetical protein